MRWVELQKLRSPGVVYCVLGGLAAIFVLVGLAQVHESGQWSIYVSGREQLADPATRDVYCEKAESEQRCDAIMAQETTWNEEFKAELIREHPYGAATQDPVAAAGVVAGWMGSFFGLVMTALLAAMLVSSEWSWGTVRVVVARTPARWRYALGKFAIVFLAAIGLTLVISVALAAAGPLLRTLYDVPPAAADWSNADYAGQRMTHAALVLSLFAALATGTALMVRHAVGAFAVTIGVGLCGIALSASRGLLDYSPGYWIGSWMDFAPEGSWTDHLWPSLFPMGGAAQPVPHDPTVGLVGIVTALVAIGVVAVVSFRRRDIRT